MVWFHRFWRIDASLHTTTFWKLPWLARAGVPLVVRPSVTAESRTLQIQVNKVAYLSVIGPQRNYRLRENSRLMLPIIFSPLSLFAYHPHPPFSSLAEMVCAPSPVKLGDVLDFQGQYCTVCICGCVYVWLCVCALYKVGHYMKNSIPHTLASIGLVTHTLSVQLVNIRVIMIMRHLCHVLKWDYM